MYGEQILAWHRRNVIEANEERLAAGRCMVHPGLPTAYLWHTRPGPAGVGNVLPLCETCCAGWRMNAADGPSMTPERIESAGQSSSASKR